MVEKKDGDAGVADAARRAILPLYGQRRTVHWGRWILRVVRVCLRFLHKVVAVLFAYVVVVEKVGNEGVAKLADNRLVDTTQFVENSADVADDDRAAVAILPQQQLRNDGTCTIGLAKGVSATSSLVLPQRRSRFQKRIAVRLGTFYGDIFSFEVTPS